MTEEEIIIKYSKFLAGEPADGGLTVEETKQFLIEFLQEIQKVICGRPL